EIVNCPFIRGARKRLTMDIGHPQLFTGATPSRRKPSAKDTVNNCAGARAPQQDSDGFRDSLALSASSVFPPRRARSANDQSHRRLSAYRPARRAGLGPLTTTPEGVAVNS